MIKKVPIITVDGRRLDSELDEIGDYVHTQLQMIAYHKGSKKTRSFVRRVVKLRYGKNVADKYSDKELEDAWYQYEPQ